MSSIQVSTILQATPDEVWAVVADLSDHVRWMEDAVAITFTSAARSGEATTFDCATKIGPIRMTDRMEVTEWEPPHAMGVRHVGAVTGTGVFTIAPRGESCSLFTWTETLTFPWWLGGPLGAIVSRPIFEHIWTTNLANLRALIDGAQAAGGSR